MLFTLNNHQLGELLAVAAALGARITLARMGRLPPYINRSEAYRRYGRKRVDRWMDRGWLTPRKDGDRSASWRIDRTEADALQAAERLIAGLWTTNQKQQI